MYRPLPHEGRRLSMLVRAKTPLPSEPAEAFYRYIRLLARLRCVDCMGCGLYISRDQWVVCNCVLRAVFRQCLYAWQEFKAQESYRPAVLDVRSGKPRRWLWGRKDIEYVADFELVGRRSLYGVDKQIFELHFLGGLMWYQCIPRLEVWLTRGNFFHAVYRVEQKLGRVFCELRPYPLYPIDEYFS